MRRVSLDTWIQLLGMLSVVAGLVFVGLEMQQTQRIALASQLQARTELISNRLLTELELFGEIGPDAITSAVEWDEMELLSDALWSQVDGYINARYSECHLREIYNASVSYQPLRDYINELPDVCLK